MYNDVASTDDCDDKVVQPGKKENSPLLFFGGTTSSLYLFYSVHQTPKSKNVHEKYSLASY